MTTKTIYNGHEIRITRVNLPMSNSCFTVHVDGEYAARYSTAKIALRKAKTYIDQNNEHNLWTR